MCLRDTLEMPAEAERLKGAVDAALASGARTADLAGKGAASLSTQAMGDTVLRELERA